MIALSPTEAAISCTKIPNPAASNPRSRIWTTFTPLSTALETASTNLDTSWSNIARSVTKQRVGVGRRTIDLSDMRIVETTSRGDGERILWAARRSFRNRYSTGQVSFSTCFNSEFERLTH